MDIVDLPDLIPGDGQQLYEVSSAGVNFADTHQRKPPLVARARLGGHAPTRRAHAVCTHQVVWSSFVRSLAARCPGDVAQLARKVSAWCEGVPGSAVKVMSVWPGSAASAKPS
jgi:hypothetical protein